MRSCGMNIRLLGLRSPIRLFRLIYEEVLESEFGMREQTDFVEFNYYERHTMPLFHFSLQIEQSARGVKS